MSDDKIEINLPAGLENIEFVEGVDLTAQFNIRKWVEDALKARGAKITGKGYGVGGSDLDFEIENCRFNVLIKFR